MTTSPRPLPPITVDKISLDGVPTLRLARGRELVGYLQARRGWIGARKPTTFELAEIDLDAVAAQLGVSEGPA